jgi:hypothetical protein
LSRNLNAISIPGYITVILTGEKYYEDSKIGKRISLSLAIIRR